MAPVYAEMARRRGLGEVDSVVFVDVVTLQGLLKVAGPVTVDGTEYTVDNAAKKLLHENYVQFGEHETTEQVARRDSQGRVASAAFDALQSRDYSLPALAGVLQDAAVSRHLLIWSSRPEEQAMWVDLEAAGALHPEGLIISAQNVAANKLDLWVKPSVDLDVRIEGDHRRVTLTYAVENLPRDRTSDYIEGNGLVVPRGHYRQYLVLYLPHFAHDISTEEPEGFRHEGNDGDNFSVGMVFAVPPGESREVTVEFSLPLSQKTLHVLSSGRLLPIAINFRGHAIHDGLPLELPLGGYPFGGR
jgi:hypothetical protein